MWAHWCHLANMIELVLLRPTRSTTQTANRSVQPFLHSSRQKVPILYSLQWATFPPKLPLLMGDLGPDLIHDSLGHSEIIIQTASRSVQPFSHRWPQCPYTLLWAPLSPKIAPSHAVIWTPSNTIPWAHPRPQPKRHLDRFSCFCRAH